MRRKALIVLGMHRSGTSALTRVLNLAGAFLPEKVMPPVPGNNERGFWEPAELVAASERALAAAGVPWDSPRQIDPAWFDSESAEHSVFELVRFFARNFAGQRLFVIKDPRLCRIVPLLHRALKRSAIDGAFILSLRHPSAVAASLAARDGMPRDHSRALWLRHVLDAERWTRGSPRIFIGMDEVMSDWAAMLAKASVRLGVRFADNAAIRASVAEFLEPKLVHHQEYDQEPLPPLIGTAWSAMQRLQAGKDTKQVRDKLDRIWNALEVADEVLGAAFSWSVELRQRTERRAKTAERERDAAHAELARAKADLDASAALGRELEGLRGALHKQSSAMASLSATLAKQEATLKERDESIRKLGGQLEAKHAEVLQRAERIRRIEALLREQDKTVQDLRSQLDSVRADLTSYRLQSQRQREQLELTAKHLTERTRFLRSMAQAALERARHGGKAA